MTISIWRYSHLALAISSFLFITLASVTGIILAFEPILEKSQPYNVDAFNQISIADALEVFGKTQDEIIDISVDENQFVIVKAIDADGNDSEFYADPKTGKALGKVARQSDFFQWITDFHRSLFLHETGRFIVGLFSFLLLLIAISGTVLVVQRQRGVKRFFSRIVRENFFQYYHVVLGRLSLIPIIIIALTGTYLTLVKFEVFKEQKISHTIDFDAINSEPKKKTIQFEVFKNTPLAEVRKIEFPFSDDPEDYFTVRLAHRELVVNQFTGEILSEAVFSKTTLLNDLSLTLHTGRSSIFWSVILAIASANILFFIYSGFAMTLKRRRNRLKNNYKKDDCNYIILVGSENGTTFRFANFIHNELIKNGQKSFIAELNNYTVFPKAEYLFVVTATYGLGDAPTNASKFLKKLQEIPQPNNVNFSVLGLGSHAYADFCKFAFDVNNALLNEKWAKPLLEVRTVNDKSPEDFERWSQLLSQKIGIPFAVSSELNSKPTRLQNLTVVAKTKVAHIDGAFLIRLKFTKKTSFTSGDLLAIFPADDYRERLYSVGKVDGEIQLSVKLHEFGLGSRYLYNLNVGDVIEVQLRPNEHFYFPKAKSVILISNGTGIAPFLGMIDENEKKTAVTLYCGFRDASSYELYQSSIENNRAENKISAVNVAFSREGNKHYVKDLILRDGDSIVSVLQDGGVIMICGSLAMQKKVFEILETICREKNAKDLAYYQSRKQLLTDCY